MEIPGAGKHASFGIRRGGQDPAAPIRSQAPSRPAGAASSSFFGREFPEGLLGVIVATSAVCIGLGLWCMKKIKECAAAAAAERSARPSSKIDWVEAGAVSPTVRKQNGCDCCWAMAAVASVEAVHYLKTMQSISLSVQELTDCDTTNNGCKTGNSDSALSEFTPTEVLLGVIVATSALCVGLGLWCMKKIEERAERSARPSKIDWVEAGAVSPIVRKQNDCDCCWAMAAVASVEAVHYLKTRQSIFLSVQELIDCDTTNDGCKYGHSKRALMYIQKNGLSSESSYPYMARRTIAGCKKDTTVAARISGLQLVDCNEDALEKAVAKQPVVVRLQYTTDLRKYKGGIMDYDAFPPTTTDEGHFVLIVGYGTSPDGIKYWRLKNSWGESWGEGGFGRIRRHVVDKRGVLGMFMYQGVYPVLKS